MTTNIVNHSQEILPRLIRFRDAPRYLGMDRNRFNREVRGEITEIKIGKQGIAFDRLELDRWVDHYIKRNGRPGNTSGDELWDERKLQGSLTEMESGTLINGSMDDVFAKAAAQVIMERRKLN